VCVSRNSTYLATLTTLSRLHHASCVVHCIMHHASCVVHCIMHHVSYTASCIMHHVSYVAGGRDDDAVMGARLVSFLVDLSLLAHGSLHFAPSLLAAAAHSLVAHALAHRRTSDTKGGVQDKGWQVRAQAPPPGLYGVVGTGVLWDVSTLCAVVPPPGLYGVVGTGVLWDVSTLCAVVPRPVASRPMCGAQVTGTAASQRH
jgi:hypothetical protein